MGTIGTSKSSYLRKNHAGAPFAAGDARRFFVQDGFQVQYYDSDARTKRNGRFDLRNIVTLRPTADPSVTDGVELVISVNGDGVATKTITVSFDDAKEEAPMWKAMWCSAVGETAVDERLKGFRQAALVKKFNFEHCEQPAMKPTMFNTPGILTPRTPGEKPAEAAVAETPDTPRAGAPSAAPITKLGMPKGAPNSAAPTAPKGPPPSTETAAADDTFEVTVPEGVKPGEVLHANTPGGVKVRLRVPEGATPGAVLAFTMPTGGTTTVDAAVKIQAIYRGKTARKGLVEEDAAEVQAAIKVQAITRGYTARFEIEEARRLEWFNYYKLPEVGEYDEALKLACTAEERAEVDAAQEASRVEWVRYYVATGNLSEAKRLLWDGKNPAPPGAGWFRCCYNPAPPAGGADRAEKFRAAIVAYDFAEAERLAATAEEKEDVSLSQRRLEWLSYYLAKRDFYEAENQAIIQSEKDLIVAVAQGGMSADAAAARLVPKSSAAGGAARKNGLRAALRAYDFDEAESLAATAEEKSDVALSRSRVEWLFYRLAARDFTAAAALTTTRAEVQMVAEVKAGASLAGYARAANPVREGTPCADLLLCRPPRAERFKRAVREYKWAEARNLAATAEEMHDVSLSVARVAQMEALLSRKAYPAARQYSITTDEIARIDALEGK